MDRTKQSVKLQNVNIKTHKYAAFSRWRFGSNPQMTIPFRLYLHASSTKTYIKVLAQRQAFVSTAMELRQMFLYILHTYMKTTMLACYIF